MLYYSGYTKRIGEVDRGDTVMDYLPEERERGITITSAAIQFPWRGHEINLIDTPGHVDFTFEVERSLRVLDGAVAILDASAGVQAQTRTVWRQSGRYGLPKVVFVNKLDKVGASFDRCIADLRDVLKSFPIPIQRPITHGKILDLINDKILTWSSPDGSVITENSIDEEHQVIFQEAKDEMLELIAEKDDAFLEAFLNDPGQISPTDIKTAIRRLTLAGQAVPVLAGASFQNIGVQTLLDAVVDYLPYPPPQIDDRLRMLAFKCIHDHQMGMLVYVRVYSGALTPRTPIYNMTSGGVEMPAKIMKAFSNDFEETAEIAAGQIGVLLGLKSTMTGDTLIYPGDKDHPGMKLPGIQVPEPVFFCSVEPHSASEEAKLDAALEIIASEDPSFKVVKNPEGGGQTLLSGIGELHLEIVRNRIQKEMKVKADFGALEISYRECCTAPIEASTAISDNAAVTLSLEPQDRVANEIVLNGFPADVHDTVFTIINGSLQRSPISGHPIINTKVTLSFQNCGPAIEQVALIKSIPPLINKLLSAHPLQRLEPVMGLVIECPSAYAGAIMNDLHSRRRGSVQMHRTSEADASIQIIEADAPLAELLGYSSYLRSLSHGHASLILEPNGFQSAISIMQ